MVEVEIVGSAGLPVSHGSGDSGVWERVLYRRTGVAPSGRPRFVADL